MCFDPQALTSLTAKTTSGATPVKGFDPQALTSLTRDVPVKGNSHQSFDPQALTSLTFEQCTGIKIN